MYDCIKIFKVFGDNLILLNIKLNIEKINIMV